MDETASSEDDDYVAAPSNDSTSDTTSDHADGVDIPLQRKHDHSRDVCSVTELYVSQQEYQPAALGEPESDVEFVPLCLTGKGSNPHITVEWQSLASHDENNDNELYRTEYKAVEDFLESIHDEQRLNGRVATPLINVPPFVRKVEMSFSEMTDEECQKTGTWENAGVPIAKWLQDPAERDLWRDFDAVTLPDDTPVQDRTLTITIDYCLSNPMTVSIHSETGRFRWRTIVTAICTSYKRAYEEELESLSEEDKQRIDPANRGPCRNRPVTAGARGIWGHDLEDLWIEALSFDAAEKRVLMFIGS